MFVDYTPEQKDLQRELREYFGRLITPELAVELSVAEGGSTYREIIQRMGADGWLGVGWPEQYGGQGRTWLEQMIFFDEARKAGAPLPFVTLNTVGPAIMDHGSPEQKDKFLKSILAGEVHFAIGYSEPEAGTDLASLKTRAVLDGDEYVVNGTKMFTSGADDADYIWLATRTGTEESRHKGITILIASTSDPGFSASPIMTVGDVSTTMSYYNDVRVPTSMRVGKENDGWKLITLQLNHERVGLAAHSGMAVRLVAEVAAWARETLDTRSRPIADHPWAQIALGEAFARAEALKVMNWRMGWELEQGRLQAAQASAAKVYGTETLIDIYRLLVEVLGLVGIIKQGSPGAMLQGLVEKEWRVCQINTFGGGVNEIQREIIAMIGLGMPRAPR